MAKKRMKGLKLFRFWPEIENSITGYNTGAQVMFPWAMEISESPDSKDEPIYAHCMMRNTMSLDAVIPCALPR